MVRLIKAPTVVEQRRLEMRERLWPGLSDDQVWNRKLHQGFCTVPRTLPIIISIMDGLAKKGQPLGSTYHELWCRVYDEGLVELTNRSEHALHAGFSGQRGERTWRERLIAIDQLGFIRLAPRPPHMTTHVLILNPYLVMADLKKKGRLSKLEDKWLAFITRSTKIGASDELAVVKEQKRKT